jgi:hypothetical protein
VNYKELDYENVCMQLCITCSVVVKDFALDNYSEIDTIQVLV